MLIMSFNRSLNPFEMMGTGDCLQEKVNMANQGAATADEISYLK